MSTYKKTIYPNSTDSHQSSPAYMLTFVRLSNRDTFNYEGESTDVRKPLIVYNDAISVTVSNSKTSITPSLSVVLLGGDINYSTAIAPGDLVYCNMVNDAEDVHNRLIRKAKQGVSINQVEDGFKGFFKVQTVRKKLQIDPNTGIKRLVYFIQAYGFTEFNTAIYYDPQLASAFTGNYAIFMESLNAVWSNVFTGKEKRTIDEILKLLISVFLGDGTKKINQSLPANKNTMFKVNGLIGGLLGVNSKTVSDIYNYIIGTWSSNSSSASNLFTNKTPLKKGFNPNIERDKNHNAGFYKASSPLDGKKIMEAEFWNNVKLWDILSKYANLAINEMYTTYRVNPNGLVMPTLVVRQKPFNSEHFKAGKTPKAPLAEPIESDVIFTTFMSLPRWSISPTLVYSMDLGRDEAARINFVQINTRTLSANDANNRALQAGTKNYVADVADIQRNGLRPYIGTANFDFPDETKKTKGKQWAQLAADWLINGHLREAGIIECVGIEAPISIGDNIQIDNTVYHIDAITHTMGIGNDGKKQFRTQLKVSFGTDIRSNEEGPIYPQMEFTDALSEREADWLFNQYMPGFSDTQDIAGRVDGEELIETKEKSFSSNKPKKRKEKDGTIIDGLNREVDDDSKPIKLPKKIDQSKE